MTTRHEPTGYSALRAPLLTVDETAAFLGVARSTVFRLIRNGELRPVRVGQRHRFRPEDLDAYLEREASP
jgi:excisionase family DNA binding protein